MRIADCRLRDYRLELGPMLYALCLLDSGYWLPLLTTPPVVSGKAIEL
jgi:hypothetical protein